MTVFLLNPIRLFSHKYGPNLTPQRIGSWLKRLAIALFICQFSGQWLGRYYPFELFSHFWIQYGWATYALIGLGLIYKLYYRMRTIGYGSVLVLVLFLSHLNEQWLPGDYAGTGSARVSDVRVFHANVLYTRDDYESTLSLLRRQTPDLYVLQEMTPSGIRLVTAQLRREFPHWFACWSKGPAWTLVGSRTPIQANQLLAKQRRIITLTTRIDGRVMRLVTVHPRTPLLPSWFHERNEQLAFVAHTTRYNALPTVLIGDFNISVFSPVYKDIFRLRERTARGNVGTLQAGRHQLTQPTWPRFLPPLLIPIDHAFANDGFRPLLFRTFDHPGSDHKAVVFDLNFSPGRHLPITPE